MPIDFKSAPFDEAISYLENRIALPSERWNDYKDSEANAAFWSAGAVDATLVSDLQKSVTRAIQNGTPYDSPEFAAQIAGFSEQYGWDLKGGADWRARLILSQNLRQSYAAGRHDQQYDPDVMKLQPYLQYVHSDSRAPRPAHVALDGKVFRKDDPIWGSINPPNGFNCGCYTVSLSQRQLDKKGLEVEQIKLGDTLPYIDSNGQIKQAIIEPDKGFNSAPSSNAEQRKANLERLMQRLSPPSFAKLVSKEISGLAKSSDLIGRDWQEYISKAKEYLGDDLLSFQEAIAANVKDSNIKNADLPEAKGLLRSLFNRSASVRKINDGFVSKVRIMPEAEAERSKDFWRENMADFYALTYGKGVVARLEKTDDRASANPLGSVNVGSQKTAQEARATLFHELGHHLEFQDLKLRIAASQFVADRATGKPQKLAKLTGNKNYKNDEKALPDNFIDPYVGKIYENGTTEVISMGMERFSSSEKALEFLEKDPEHFLFVFGAILK